MNYPVILIHGYSDVPKSFDVWKAALQNRGFDVAGMHTCGYRSLTNEVTIKDIAEGFDRALRIHPHLGKDEPFDAIVHSTGMLVLRAWLTTYARTKRVRRLKRLIALAPASFGSPLAHKGRSWLGAIFKGNREKGPDFMEAGDLVLDGLELGSRYTWDLAHRDLVNDDTIFYGPDPDTPYVFTFCGMEAYRGFKGMLTNPDGSDGTVRWAGCSLNTRKITLNLTLDPEALDAKDPAIGASISEAKKDSLEKVEDKKQRIEFNKWKKDERCHLAIPFIPIAGLNHNTILTEPTRQLIDLVTDALKVTSKEAFCKWNEAAVETTKHALDKKHRWQQFIVRAVDERGDPITDYHIRLQAVYKNQGKKLKALPADVHTYSGDKSFRCFHVNLTALRIEEMESLRIEIIASAGTDLVGYHGYVQLPSKAGSNTNNDCTALLEMDQMLSNQEVKFFYPYTTTLIELQLNREPLPLEKENKVTWFYRD